VFKSHLPLQGFEHRVLINRQTRSRGRGWRWLAFIGASLLAPPAIWAQTDAGTSAIQFNVFNLSAPGARSLGMGGAFIGLADDATSAYANPAGLTTLTRPEVSVEARNWSSSQVFTDRGRRFGTPSQMGVDTISGLQNGETSGSISGLSFFSAVYPDKHGNWTLALYRHELAHFRVGFDTQGAIINDLIRISPSRNSVNLSLLNLVLAAGFHITDGLSAGAGISRYELSLNSLTQLYGIPGSLFAPPSYAPLNVEVSEIQKGHRVAFGFNLGLKWQASTAWQLGATYRQGPGFDFTARAEKGPAGTPQFESARTARFKAPGVWGLGVAYQPPRTTATFTLDYVRVQYSALAKGFTSIFAAFSPPDDPRNFRVPDANELHIGVEYIFPKIFKLPKTMGQLAARVGAWRDPAHQVRYEGQNQVSQALLMAGHDEMHYSAGLGLSRFIPRLWRRGKGGTEWHFQLDAAYDYSPRLKTAALSTLLGF
jgi:long-chain fatty acid transport protein